MSATTASPSTKNSGSGRFISLRLKLLVVFTLLFTVVFSVAYYWFYTFATDVAERQIREDLTNTLLAAADGVDGDAFAAFAAEAEVRDDGYTNDIRFWDHSTWLNRVHKLEPRAFVYSYQVSEDQSEVYFIGSMGAVWVPPAGATFREQGSFRTDQGSPKLRGLTQTTFSDEVYTDDFGTWISGYTAIRNSAGEVVGGLGVDFQAEYVTEVQNRILSNIWWAFALTYLLLFALVSWLARTFTQPIIQLTSMAERVGEGEYHQDFAQLTQGRFRDEIDSLAHVFSSMVNKVDKREQKLKERVRSLKIQIDEKKKQEQVSEIVDTDFFSDLQSRAAEMRKRHARKQDSDVEKQSE
ncbi:MAG: HAMP domain-containing protein [Anaerolineales bacterium]|nr:HAMP domain-containing protein [Anaerolineales bacterium]